MAARPDAINQGIGPAFAEEISVAVAGEDSRAGAERVEAAAIGVLVRHLEFADRGLLIWQSHMLGPVLGREFDRHAGGEGRIDQLLVEALGMKIELDLAAGEGDPLKDGAPEVVAAFADAAFTMGTYRNAADVRACFEQRSKRVARVGGVVLRSEAFDRVVGVGRVGPLITVGPDAKLKVDAMSDSLLTDEAQHLEIAIALSIGQIHGTYFVAGHVEEKWIDEEQV